MSLRVLRPGIGTTVQDLGRPGYQQFGVVVGGAMDAFALRAANLLVGNVEGEAGLELTVVGPSLYLAEDTLIAVCGADLSPQIDGRPIPLWRPVWVRAGATLQFGTARSGCRAYVAAAGGFELPLEMGSRSTYVRAGIGGLQGRALKEGDVLQLRAPSVLARRMGARLQAAGPPEAASYAAPFAVSGLAMPAYSPNPEIRVLKGRQWDLFEAPAREVFFTESFVVTPQSDRMGYRLSGPTLRLREPQEMISEAVTFGTIQVPAGGNPIVLMADRQTSGGYPKIAQVITVDLPRMAQVGIGRSVRFREVSLEEAQLWLARREMALRRLRVGLQLQFG